MLCDVHLVRGVIGILLIAFATLGSIHGADAPGVGDLSRREIGEWEVQSGPAAAAKQSLPFIGMAYRNLSAAEASSAGLQDSGGVLIVDAAPGGPADAAGLRANDVIVRINEERIERRNDLLRELGRMAAGQTLKVEYVRAGRKQNAEIRTRPAPGTRMSVQEASNGHSLLSFTRGMTPTASESSFLYYNAAAKMYVRTLVTAKGTVATISYRPEDLARNEYSGAVLFVTAGGTQGTGFEHTRWEGEDQFTVRRDFAEFNGDDQQHDPSETGLRSYRRVK